MGNIGRPPKPTAIKMLEGNPGKRELGKNEPDMPLLDAEVKPPKYLLADAKKEWKRIAPVLASSGVLTVADIPAFAAYCNAFARWQQAEQQLDKTGLTIIDADGIPKANPLVLIAQKYLQEVKDFAKEFGLTPSARVGILANVNTSKKKASSNPLEDILNSTATGNGKCVPQEFESNFS